METKEYIDEIRELLGVRYRGQETEQEFCEKFTEQFRKKRTASFNVSNGYDH